MLEILHVFIYLFVIGIGISILWLHADFWVDIDHPLFAFLTLPFCPIIALIKVVINVVDFFK